MKPFWRRRLLTPFLALLALNAATFVVYTIPRGAQERSIAARAAVLREQVARRRDKVQALRLRAQTIQSNDADVERFYRGLRHKGSLLKVQEDIAASARDHGLQVGDKSYTNEEVKGSSALERFEINMPVAGTYRQIADFLRRLEALPHFVVVNSIQLRQSRTRTEEAGNIHLNVVLSAYFLAEGATPDAR